MSSQPPTQQSQEVEEDTLVADTRAFWKERGRALVGDSPKAIDDAAKQVITIAGIVIGFYECCYKT
jgi:hypothetical protein